MRPLASDLNAGGTNPSVDWLRMSPYPSSGTFESRVFDTGKSGTDWNSLTSITQKPAGTEVTFETRSGNSATPDGSWSGWEAVGSGGAIASPSGRYIQYRANLSSTDASVSPTIEQVTIIYRRDATPPAAPSRPDLAAESDSGASDTDDITNDATRRPLPVPPSLTLPSSSWPTATRWAPTPTATATGASPSTESALADGSRTSRPGPRTARATTRRVRGALRHDRHQGA